MQVKGICLARVRCYCVRASNPLSSTTSRCQARGPGVRRSTGRFKGLPPLSVGSFTKVTLVCVFQCFPRLRPPSPFWFVKDPSKILRPPSSSLLWGWVSLVPNNQSRNDDAPFDGPQWIRQRARSQGFPSIFRGKPDIKVLDRQDHS